MITVCLLGGMGNQMFQYAFGLAQAKRLGTSVRFDASWLAANRPLSLLQWDMSQFPLVSRQTPNVLEQGMKYNQEQVDQIKDGDVLQGYWQSEKHIQSVRDELLNLRPLNRRRDLEDQILAEENSVAVHVRRGDYLIEPHKSFHGNLECEYYSSARQYIRDRVNNPRFFFFSDNPKWVANTFYTDFSLGRDVVVEPSNEAADIFAMSLCDHVITANSSFSWWGAYLGDPRTNEIVISPKRWFMADVEEGIVPERWVKI